MIVRLWVTEHPDANTGEHNGARWHDTSANRVKPVSSDPPPAPPRPSTGVNQTASNRSSVLVVRLSVVQWAAAPPVTQRGRPGRPPLSLLFPAWRPLIASDGRCLTPLPSS